MMATYQQKLRPGEDIEIITDAPASLTTTRYVKGTRRIRIKANAPVQTTGGGGLLLLLAGAT